MKAGSIDVAYLRECFSYDTETGVITWRERPRHHFGSDHTCRVWNTKNAGRELTHNSNGYVLVAINRRLHKSHRVAWAIATGEWPDGQIDHINGVRNDNRLCNLRVVSNLINSMNRGRKKNNTSGVTGVYWSKQAKKWQAYINVGRRQHLGYYDEISAAAAARKAAERRLGFHENHGRSA